jgi:hypothetical protein
MGQTDILAGFGWKTMAHCCEDKRCEIVALRAKHRRVLWIVLLINAVMFVVEGGAGLLARSTSLLADALDMLGDALVYGFSLFVLARSAHWQAGAALMKGGFMLAFGLGVLGEAVYKAFYPVMPGVEMMGLISGVALAANLVCFFLLYRYRSDNLNLRSTWLCSRNDLLRSTIAQVGGKKELTGRTDIEIEISNQCARLIANTIIFYNSAILSRLLTKYEASGNAKALALITQVSPAAWRHILLNGHYTFQSDGTMIDLDRLVAGLELG